MSQRMFPFLTKSSWAKRKTALVTGLVQCGGCPGDWRIPEDSCLWTVYNTQYTVYRVHIQCTLHTTQCTGNIHSVQYTLHSVQGTYTVYSWQCTVNRIDCTITSDLYSVGGILVTSEYLDNFLNIFFLEKVVRYPVVQCCAMQCSAVQYSQLFIFRNIQIAEQFFTQPKECGEV